MEDLERFGPVIEYIGYPKDSVYAGVGNEIFEALRNHLITPEFRRKNAYHKYSEGKIAIRVYNKRIIKMIYNKYETINSPPCILNCYAVMIVNIDTLPIDIALFARRPMALEEEQNGIWKTIKEEDNFMSTIECNGDSHYFIRPNEIIVVTIPIIRNKNKNQRLRINKAYSNVFQEP